jgi:hypothetical protein
MLTTLASKVATSFILDMFVGKHYFTQILCPFLMLKTILRRRPMMLAGQHQTMSNEWVNGFK